MQGQLLVTLQGIKKARSRLFDKDVDELLWVSFEERATARTAVASIRVIDEKPVVVPRGKTTMSLVGQGHPTCAPISLDWDLPSLLLLCNEEWTSACVLHVRPVPKGMGRYSRVCMEEGKAIVIGRSRSCDIRYDNRYVSGEHARVHCDGTRTIVEDLRSANGTMVNGVMLAPLQPRWLRPGDVVQVLDLTFMVGHGFLCMNEPDDVHVMEDALRRVAHANDGHTCAWDITGASSLDDASQRFYPAPRLCKSVHTCAMRIEAPPRRQAETLQPAFVRTVSSLLMGLSSLAMLMPALLRIWEGESLLTVMPLLAMGVSMVGMSVVLPAISRVHESRQRAREELQRVSAYGSYVDAIERQLKGKAEEQAQVLQTNRLGIDQIKERVRSRSSLLMNRTRSHEDFLQLRVGLGDQEVGATISWPELGLDSYDDPLFSKLDHLRSNVPSLQNVPLTIDLLKQPVIGVLGESGVAWEFLRGLLVQVCAFHSYEEVKVLLIVCEEDREQWEFATFLGHSRIESSGQRLVAVSQAGMADVERLIECELGRSTSTVDGADGQPHVHFVTICANKELYGGSRGIKRLVGARRCERFSLVFVGAGLQDLPRECDYLVCLDQSGADLFMPEIQDAANVRQPALAHGRTAFMFERNDVLQTLVQFEPDVLVSREEARELSRGLSGLRLEGGDASGAMPSSLGFLELFQAGNVEQLNIGLRWKENQASRSLQVPVGVDGQGSLVYLDLHEKRHGPHGLIAGTTGSGKSEFIVTYILSLCVSYAPDEVSFVLIDYKGGGLAGAFQNKHVALPHLAGVITNLDGSEIRRSLASIRSELRRRQETFAQASEMTGDAAMDIYAYLSLYRQGRIDEPMPHLFIIADEFAELRQQEPDFMAELVSAARIGRSLGIHLILATQRPTGVVDEQIWSNARFKVALKVADASDSREMIRRDDAARISRPGNFYLLVGYGESFVEGQAAFAGFPYVARDVFEPRRDDAVELIDAEGNVLASMRPATRIDEHGVSELNAVLAHVQRQALIAGKRASKLWLEPLPPCITLPELEERYPMRQAGGLSCAIGLVDDPYGQRQFRYDLDLAVVGNAIIYGSQGSDPEGMLVAMLLGLARRHGPDDVWFYAMDLGTNRLAALEVLPHTGGVVCVDDDERMNTLFRMLDEELARRRAVLAPYGGDLRAFNEGRQEQLPYVVVALTNLAALSELMPSLFDRLIVLVRDAPRCGMHFLITANSPDAVRMRMRSSMGAEIPTQMNDTGDYASVLGQSPGFLPASHARRGLIRIDDGIFEFQGVCAGEDVAGERHFAQGIASLVGDFGGPPRIPVLPKHVRAQDMRPEGGSLGLPVGYSKRSIAPVFLDVRATPYALVLGNDASALVQYVRGMWTCLEQTSQPVRVRLVDVMQSTGMADEECVVSTTAKLAELVRCLRSGEYSLDLLVIVNVAQTIEALNAANARDLEALLEEVPGCGCALVVIVSELWRMRDLFSKWYQAAMAAECGIWVGSGFCDQTALRFARVLPEYRAPVHGEDGYVVLHGNVESVRLVSAEVRERE